MKCKNLCLFLAISSFSYAAIRDDYIDVKSKIYVQPKDITFKDNEIYVFLNQNWVKTNTVYTDAQGLFVDSSKIGWTCSYCGWYNTDNIYVCENPRCGRQRS